MPLNLDTVELELLNSSLNEFELRDYSTEDGFHFLKEKVPEFEFNDLSEGRGRFSLIKLSPTRCSRF